MTNDYLDFRYKVSVPIRDMQHPGMKVAFVVDVYGVTARDLQQIPLDEETAKVCVGSKPLVKAIRRMGLSPDRYQASIWDIF